MKLLFRVLISIAALCASASSMAQTSYSLTGDYLNWTVSGDINPGTFALATSGFISADTDFAPADLLSCQAGTLACSNVHFYMNPLADGVTTDSAVKAVGLFDAAGVGNYYIFGANAFSTPGVHVSLGDFNHATLTVSAVPEPGEVVMLLTGLGLIGVIARRRRAV